MADEAKPNVTEIPFHYLKSNLFRVVHTDGAIVGVTPSALLHVALFNERPAIPQQQILSVEDGKLGAPLVAREITRGGVIREIEVDAIMSLDAARAPFVTS